MKMLSPNEQFNLTDKRCFCGSWNIRKIWKKNSLDIIFCDDCGLCFIYPLPFERDTISTYADYLKDYEYDEIYLKDRENGAKRLKKIFLKESKISFFDKNQKIRLLDIGFRLGFFLKEVEDLFEIYGVEISSFQVNFAKKYLGLNNIFHGILTDAKFPDNYFDVITLWEVIEHLPNPLDYIREINRILKPGGILALSTPNFKGLTSLITKDKWHLCDPKEHLFYFSPKSLKNILSGNGFKIIRTATDNINIPNVVRCVRKQDINSAHIWDERKKYFRKIESSFLLAKIKRFINCFLNLTKSGDNLRVYAVKLNTKIKEPKKILVLNNHGIGDVIVSIPLLKSLRDNYPNAVIAILMRSELEQKVIANLNLCNHYYYFQRIKKSFIGKKPDNLLSFLNLIWKLRREKFDLVLNTQGVNMILAGLLSVILGASYRAGEAIGWKGLLFNIKVYPTNTHRINRNNNIGRAIGLTSFIPNPYLAIDKKADSFINKIVNKNGIDGKEFIGIHIGKPEDQFERCWAVEKYRELIYKIRNSLPQVVIVIFGSKSERTEVKKLNISGMNNILDMVGFLEIEETIAFIKRCKLFISGDSGLMHIAAALNITTIALFGPTSSDVIAPYWNDGVVIKANVTCAPCYDNEDYRKKCDDIKCMESIGVEEVFEVVRQMLSFKICRCEKGVM